MNKAFDKIIKNLLLKLNIQQLIEMSLTIQINLKPIGSQ